MWSLGLVLLQCLFLFKTKILCEILSPCLSDDYLFETRLNNVDSIVQNVFDENILFNNKEKNEKFLLFFSKFLCVESKRISSFDSGILFEKLRH
jgi:hypothetical protein